MKYNETNKLVLRVFDEITQDLWNWPGRPDPRYREFVDRRRKFESCGRSLWVERIGREVKHWCRQPMCPHCSTFHGRKTARTFLAKYPAATKSDFQMATLIFGATPDIDYAFDLFRAKRRGLHKSVDYRRRAQSIDRAEWQRFGIAGTLEIDAVEAEWFSKLGARKQEQIRSLCDPTGAKGPLWVVTAHVLVHVGGLGLEAVEEVLRGVAPIVHFRSLDDDQSLAEAAQATVGYAAKARFETTYAFGQVSEWPLDTVKSYLLGVMRNSRGRQGFKLVINPKGGNRTTNRNSNSYVDPMPVVL